jgi:hypothetical protein
VLKLLLTEANPEQDVAGVAMRMPIEMSHSVMISLHHILCDLIGKKYQTHVNGPFLTHAPETPWRLAQTRSRSP